MTTTQHPSVADDAQLISLLKDYRTYPGPLTQKDMLVTDIFAHIDTLLAAAREEADKRALSLCEANAELHKYADEQKERAEKAEAALAEANRKNLELTRVNHEQRLQEKQLKQALAEAQKSYKRPYKQAFSQFANSEDGLLAAAQPPAQAEARPEPDRLHGEVETQRSKLLRLADRIDHESLWRLSFFDLEKMPTDKKDRMLAGVMLRRYADIWEPGRWVVVPPTGSVQFSAATLDKAVEMATRDEKRRSAPAVPQQEG